MKKPIFFFMATVLLGALLLTVACNNDGSNDPEDSVAPDEVTGLSTTVGDQQVTLNWTDPDDSDLDHIAITWGTNGSAEVEPETETYTATSLTNGEEYTFTVKTVDTSGNASAGETITATPAADGTISVSIINAPNTYYLWVFAYEEDEWNTDMAESVIATQNTEITGSSAEITLDEGCSSDFSGPTGGTWTATGGETYDLIIYTTDAGDDADRQAVFPTQVTVNGDETVEVNYNDMTNYALEEGTLTVSIEGADDYNGVDFIMAVLNNGDEPGIDSTLASGEAEITNGYATITAQDSGADWNGVGGTAYDVYFLIDVSGSGNPESGDYIVTPFPVIYYQDGDKVMDTVFPDDYEEY